LRRTGVPWVSWAGRAYFGIHSNRWQIADTKTHVYLRFSGVLLRAMVC
jgi:hypothetical protein